MECWTLLFRYHLEQNVANYAYALFNLAYCKGRLENRDNLYIANLYQKIIGLSEKYKVGNNLIISSYYNWGNALASEANAIEQQGDSEEANRLREKVKALYKNFLDQYPRYVSEFAYNLGCVFACEGDIDNAIAQFEIAARENKLPTKEHIMKDTDLDNIRDTPEFQAWFKKTFN